MFLNARRLLALTLVLALFDIALAAVLTSALAAQQVDTVGGVPVPGADLQWTVAVAGLGAFIAQFLGSQITSVLNKAGGWLDSKSNGTKRIFAGLVTAGLGLLANAVFVALTHTTNWIATFALSIVAGVVAIVNTGTAIDVAKAKLTVGKSAAGTRYPG